MVWKVIFIGTYNILRKIIHKNTLVFFKTRYTTTVDTLGFPYDYDSVK